MKAFCCLTGRVFSDPPESGSKRVDRQQCSHLGQVCVCCCIFLCDSICCLPPQLFLLLFSSRCIPACSTLRSLDLSGNPSVTSAGLHSILTSIREASRPLTLLNFQGMRREPTQPCWDYAYPVFNNWGNSHTGCQVSGPWDSEVLDGLSELVQDLRLCSHGLNKLDRQALKHSWDNSRSHGHFLDRHSKCLLSAAASLWAETYRWQDFSITDSDEVCAMLYNECYF